MSENSEYIEFRGKRVVEGPMAGVLVGGFLFVIFALGFMAGAIIT